MAQNTRDDVLKAGAEKARASDADRVTIRSSRNRRPRRPGRVPQPRWPGRPRGRQGHDRGRGAEDLLADSRREEISEGLRSGIGRFRRSPNRTSDIFRLTPRMASRSRPPRHWRATNQVATASHDEAEAASRPVRRRGRIVSTKHQVDQHRGLAPRCSSASRRYRRPGRGRHHHGQAAGPTPMASQRQRHGRPMKPSVPSTNFFVAQSAKAQKARTAEEEAFRGLRGRPLPPTWRSRRSRPASVSSFGDDDRNGLGLVVLSFAFRDGLCSDQAQPRFQPRRNRGNGDSVHMLSRSRASTRYIISSWRRAVSRSARLIDCLSTQFLVSVLPQDHLDRHPSLGRQRS